MYDELNGMTAEQVTGLLQSPQRAQVEPVLEAYTKK